jgi:hypothetical protein
MIEHVLFLPTILIAHDRHDIRTVDQLARDFSIIMLVNVLEKAGFQIFRRIFVTAVCMGLFTEIINDLCFRALDPNPKFADNWNHVHKERTKHLLNIVRSSLRAEKTTSGSASAYTHDLSLKKQASTKTPEYSRSQYIPQ